MSVRVGLRVGAAALLGGMLGVASSVGDGLHLTLVNGLANAGGPWLVTAFFAGALQLGMRTSATGGALALVVAVAWYYAGFLVGGSAFLVPFLVGWAFAATALGALFGIGGGAWALRTDWTRTAGVVVLSGALLAESVYRLVLVEAWTGLDWERTYIQVAAADALIAGSLLVLLLERSRWPLALSAIPPVTTAAVVILFGTRALAGMFGVTLG